MSGAVGILIQKRIMQSFAAAGACSPETARAPSEIGCRSGWLFRRLVAREVLRDAGDGRYYLDAAGVDRFRQTLRHFAYAALVLLAIGLVVLAALALL